MCILKKIFVLSVWLLIIATTSWGQKPAVATFVALPHGFEPRIIEHKPGPVAIVVVNRSRQKMTSFRLDDNTKGKRMHDFVISSTQNEWQEVVTLTAGTYVLSEANSPGYSAILIVK